MSRTAEVMPLCALCETRPAASSRSGGFCTTCYAEIATYVAEEGEAYDNPPCQECGAMTPEEAAKSCRCNEDKDSCHGCHLWLS